MRRLIQTTALCLALATPAHADLVLQGHDAQGLHCAAMLTVVAAALLDSGQLTPRETSDAAAAAALILYQLPGTQAEKMQALRQRANKIIATRSARQLATEFKSTSRWCKREFLS